jgi:hypothetical protein
MRLALTKLQLQALVAALTQSALKLAHCKTAMVAGTVEEAELVIVAT